MNGVGAHRIACFATLGIALVFIAGCIDSVAEPASREVAVAEGSVECVREAILTSPRWGVRSAGTRLPGVLTDCAWQVTLRVEDEVVDVDVFFVARPLRLGLTTYARTSSGSITDADPRSREHLQLVYAHLREACPALPPWSATIDNGAGEGASHGTFWRGLGLTVLALLGLVGALAARAARARRTHGQREPRIPWPEPSLCSRPCASETGEPTDV